MKINIDFFLYFIQLIKMAANNISMAQHENYIDYYEKKREILVEFII